MQPSYLHAHIKAAAVQYSLVYCGQQNGGHANHRVLSVDRGSCGGESEGMGGYWGVWFERGLPGLDCGVGGC